MAEITLVFILWMYVFLFILILTGFLLDHPYTDKLKSFPKISILVPARNEEKNISACLEALLALDYPKEHLEIIVGDDGSSDETANIVKQYTQKYPFIHLVHIQGTMGLARAKSNVLAQLITQAQAPYIFVTDADICVNPKWVQNLLPVLLQQNYGIVSGTTLVRGIPLFAQYQGLDWSLGFGYLIGLDRLGMKSTAVGNNMCFTREAYLATGGYENMPFSVTEDFQLFQAIRKCGYETANLIHPHSLNISAAQENMANMLHQRKRWMLGAMKLPYYWLFIFGLQGLFYPCLFVLLCIHPLLALKIWVVKMLLQNLYLLLIHRKLKVNMNWLPWLTFELYYVPIQLAMIFFFLLPIPMQWKSRVYNP